MTTNNLNKPDLIAEDELQKILEKLVHTRENYEMLPEYDTAVDEAKAAINAYTTNKIIEELESFLVGIDPSARELTQRIADRIKALTKGSMK